jgi:hypothetical protein
VRRLRGLTGAQELTHPGLVLGTYAKDEFEQAVAALVGKRHPSDWNGAADVEPTVTQTASTGFRMLYPLLLVLPTALYALWLMRHVGRTHSRPED